MNETTTPPGAETDARRARETVEALLPDEKTRLGVLAIAGQLIGELHQTSPAGWALTLPKAGQRAHLDAGRVLALAISRGGRCWVPLPRGESFSGITQRAPFQLLEDADLVEAPAESLLQAWPEIRPAVLELVRKEAGRIKRTPYYWAHSDGFRRYVEYSLGESIPVPDYGKRQPRRAQIRRLRALIERVYPDWKGFGDPRFVQDEIEYKRKAVTKAQELLSHSELTRLIGTGELDQLLERVREVGHATNLLYLSVPSAGDLGIVHREDLDRAAFADQFVDLLYGSGDSGERLDRWSRWVEESGLRNTWPFPTYYLFLCHPEEDLFVKPRTMAAFLRGLDIDLDVSGGPDSVRYGFLKELAREIMEAFAEFGPSDMVDAQSLIWVCGRTAMKEVLQPSMREELKGLLEEFLSSYPKTTEGRKHLRLYAQSRDTARKNFDEITAAAGRGEDVTDAVLLRLLPHRDTQGNRSRGAWINNAPAVTRDLKEWFEGAGWVHPQDWPEVAHVILEFVRRCVVDPEQLDDACREWPENPLRKGFQSGMLSPILNALRPDAFLLINNKSRAVINYLADKNIDARLASYPEANAAGFELLDDFQPLLEGLESPELERQDLFDMFSHWMVAVKKHPLKAASFWKIAPEKQAKLWDDWRENGYISIGWNELGDISGISGKQYNEQMERVIEAHPDWTKIGLRQVWRFARQVQEGDWVIANRGTKEVIGLGRVTGPYTFIEGPEHSHRREVEWVDTRVREVNEPGWKRTLIKLEREKFEEIVDVQPIDGSLPPRPPTPPTPQPPVQPDYSLASLAIDSGFPEPTLEAWVRAIERKQQAVLYGPPGTGKTYLAEKLAMHLVGGGHGFRELVQFHPSYGYEDFMQGIRPDITESGELTYRVVPGRFLEFCRQARKAGEDRCVLIVDEINRANLARVFGELMYLLEYRGQEIPLAGGGTFSIPSNVRVLGTMNTADRSIALVDHALRRRFAFLRLKPDYGILRRYHGSRDTDFDPEPLIAVLEEINKQINDPHYEVGITFFLLEEVSEQLADIWKMEIEPYLEEYFFDKPETVDRFRWDSVENRLQSDS